MSLVGRPAENHPQQVAVRGALDKVDDRRTPRELWDPLNKEFRFTLDAAASADNALLPFFFDRHDDALTRPWSSGASDVPLSVWCNPPYSDCGAWVRKAWQAWDLDGARTIVMLLPANRTEQTWWQELVEPHRDGRGVLETRFLRGRLRFDTPPDTYSDPRGNRPPFGCVLLIWNRQVPAVTGLSVSATSRAETSDA